MHLDCTGPRSLHWWEEGGKTTAMFRIAREFSEDGKNVILTSTTKISRSEGEKADYLLFHKKTEDLESEFSKRLRRGEIVTIVSGEERNNKLIGLNPDLVDELAEVEDLTLIMVEGDGAKRKSLKAPAEHEPVIPSSTDLVIPVVGIDVVGKPSCSENVHRPELICDLTRFKLGEIITPELVAQVLTNDEGGIKGVSSKFQIIPLINKVEIEGDENNATAVATAVAERILDLGEGIIKKAVLGRFRAEDPIVKVITTD